MVTGASGFIAIHCIQQLLNQGYKVRGTVRSLQNEKKVKPLKDLEHSEALELVEADLTKDDGWSKLVILFNTHLKTIVVLRLVTG